MTIASPYPTAYDTLQPLLDWQAAAFESLTQAQNLQLQWLSAWQQVFRSTRNYGINGSPISEAACRWTAVRSRNTAA